MRIMKTVFYTYIYYFPITYILKTIVHRLEHDKDLSHPEFHQNDQL